MHQNILKRMVSTMIFRSVETLPLVYCFIWLTPSFVMEQLVAAPIFFLNGKSNLQELFPKLVENQKINIEFNFEVKVK